jgi:hypothetical protein
MSDHRFLAGFNISSVQNHRRAIDSLKTLLAQLGPPPEAPKKDFSTIYTSSKTTVNQIYHEFMKRNEGRSLDTIRDVKLFYEGGLSKVTKC